MNITTYDITKRAVVSYHTYEEELPPPPAPSSLEPFNQILASAVKISQFLEVFVKRKIN